MKKINPANRLLNAATKSALVAIVAQLSLGTVAVNAATEQTLMNSTLPLPDGNYVSTIKKETRVAKPVDTAKSITNTPGATAVALRFFGKKPDQAKTETAATVGTVGGINVKLAPAQTKSESQTEPKLEPRLEPKLETTPSWVEENAPQASAKPVVPPIVEAATTVQPEPPVVLRDQIPVAPEATATVPPSTVAETAVPTTNELAPANTIIPAEALKLSDPIKQEPNMALLVQPPSPAGTHSGIFSRAPIFIDNDEAIEQEETIQYEELPLDDETKTKVKAGARFPIVITSEITSRTSKKGDPVSGRLKYDLKIGDRLVAKKGSVVRGHLNYSLKARTPMASLVSANRWYKNSGCLGVTFDEILNEKNEHIPLVAEPARAALYVKNKAEGRVLGINHKGQIAGPWSQQLKYKSIRVGMNFAMAPLGVMSFGAMPVALGVIGAANPSFAFMKPVGTNVRHRRIKGFAWGFLGGVPGSWLIEDTTIKGQEAVIKPGDEFLAELRQEFTGEPATEAEMLGGADAKVHGEVVGKSGGKIDRKKKKASKDKAASI